MNDLRGPPYANGAAPPLFPPNGSITRALSTTRRSVQMAKRAGEGSFGMTLDQETNATADDCPRVSYVFPNSAASRAGVRPGWTIEFINGISCRGRRVREVAPIFREHQQVILYVDICTESATPPTLPPLIGGINLMSPPASAPRAPTPPPLAWPPQPSVPPPPQVSGVAATGAVPPALLDMMRAGVAEPAHSSSVTIATQPLVPAASLPQPRMEQPGHQRPPASAALTQAVASVSPPTMSQPTPVTSSNDSSPVASIPISAVSTATIVRGSATMTPAVSAPVSTTVPLAGYASTDPPTAIPASPTVPTVTAAAASSTPAHSAAPTSTTTAAAAAATHTTPTTSRAAGKKRSRAQSENKAPASATPPTATRATPPTSATSAGRGRGRQQRRRQSAPVVSELWDSDDAVCVYGSDDPDVEEVPSPRAGSTSRRTSSRQAESGGRARRSLTVSRLMTMGFKQEDAELSVQNCGHDPDKCMIWIVSYLEEKQFMNDLNRASIESENQRRLDAQQQKQEESETLRQATAFTSLFQTSYILSDIAAAPRLKAMLASTIGDIGADTLMRTLMTKLLTVESKAIRWYKEACKCYMLELAARLETAYASHDAVTCCSKLLATEQASEACSFVRALHEEEQALSKALFFMPENQGGVPLAFLRADESMQFSLDDDGFEVVDQPPAPASPGQD